jgi:hypothetical protein
MEQQIWKPIDGTNGYEINQIGHVRCWCHFCPHKGAVLLSQPRECKTHVRKDKYLGVHIRVERNKSKALFVHIEVAKNFVDNPDNLSEVNHEDGDKQNPYYKNLKWVTHSENIKHAWDNGLIKIPVGQRGFNAKLTDEQALQIYNSTDPKQDIINRFNIGSSTYHRIKNAKAFRHILTTPKQNRNQKSNEIRRNFDRQ